jgi:hypothetical protein
MVTISNLNAKPRPWRWNSMSYASHVSCGVTGMGGNIPTWKIREGSCRHSLAFAVMAQQCGEDKAVVKRALQLYEVSTYSSFDIDPSLIFSSTVFQELMH